MGRDATNQRIGASMRMCARPIAICDGLPRMDIRHVRSFVAAAEVENFSRAALALHLAQSALSRHIATLELEVGEPLFVRRGRGVLLSDAGRRLLPEARLAVEAFDRLVSVAGDISAADGGRPIAAGMLGSHAEVLLPRLLARLATTTLRLNLVEGFSSQLGEGVATGRLDLALVPLVSDDCALVVEPVTTEPMALVGVDVGERTPLALETALTMPLVLPSPDTLERRSWERLAARFGQTLQVAGEADSYGMEVSLARHGHGCMLVGQSSAVALAREHGLRWRPVVGMAPSLMLISRSAPTPAVRQVAAAIKEEVRALFAVAD
jgi:LysR family nitrogen assimilation transcriptional regulator